MNCLFYTKIIAFTFDEITSSLSNILRCGSLLDAHDAVYLEIMSRNKIRNILTEDSDFNNIINIDVYHV